MTYFGYFQRVTLGNFIDAATISKRLRQLFQRPQPEIAPLVTDDAITYRNGMPMGVSPTKSFNKFDALRKAAVNRIGMLTPYRRPIFHADKRQDGGPSDPVPAHFVHSSTGTAPIGGRLSSRLRPLTLADAVCK
jgi:hypothetical protein